MEDQWKNELKQAFDKKKTNEMITQNNISEAQTLFLTFIAQVARSAMEEVAAELNKYDLETAIHDNGLNAIGITIKPKGKHPLHDGEFHYSIEMPTDAQRAHPVVKIRFYDKKDGKLYQTEGVIKSGAQDYTVKDITKEDVIHSLTTEYKYHIN